MQIFNTYQELIASEAYEPNTCTVLAFGHSDEYHFESEENISVLQRRISTFINDIHLEKALKDYNHKEAGK